MELSRVDNWDLSQALTLSGVMDDVVSLCLKMKIFMLDLK